MHQHQGRVYGKLSSSSHSGRQLKLRAAEGRPSVAVIPVRIDRTSKNPLIGAEKKMLAIFVPRIHACELEIRI